MGSDIEGKRESERVCVRMIEKERDKERWRVRAN